MTKTWANILNQPSSGRDKIDRRRQSEVHDAAPIRPANLTRHVSIAGSSHQRRAN